MKQVPRRAGAVGAPLDRQPFSFRTTRDPAFRFPQRRVHDDRPRSRWPTVAARLLGRLGQLRGGTRVLLDQGAGRPADQQAPHLKVGDPIIVGKSRPAPWCSTNLLPGKHLYPARHRHRPRALPVDHQGSRDLRPFEKVVLVHGCRQVCRNSPMARRSRRICPATIPGRDDLEPVDLLPDRDPRAVPQPAGGSPT